MTPARTGHCGDLGGGKPNTPTVPYVQHSGVMEGSEWDASAYRTMQEWVRAKETVPGSGGGEVGHLQGLQCIWTPPRYGDLF